MSETDVPAGSRHGYHGLPTEPSWEVVLCELFFSTHAGCMWLLPALPVAPCWRTDKVCLLKPSGSRGSNLVYVLAGQDPSEGITTLGTKNTSCMLGVVTLCVFQTPAWKATIGLFSFTVEELITV